MYKFTCRMIQNFAFKFTAANDSNQDFEDNELNHESTDIMHQSTSRQSKKGMKQDFSIIIKFKIYIIHHTGNGNTHHTLQ